MMKSRSWQEAVQQLVTTKFFRSLKFPQKKLARCALLYLLVWCRETSKRRMSHFVTRIVTLHRRSLLLMIHCLNYCNSCWCLVRILLRGGWLIMNVSYGKYAVNSFFSFNFMHLHAYDTQEYPNHYKIWHHWGERVIYHFQRETSTST